MSLFALFDRLEQLPVGAAIRESVWLFPVIEALHLLGLALLGGAVLMLDLRLLGFGVVSQRPSVLERQTRPWFLGALAVLLATGALLFLSEAVKLHGKDAFWLKMAALAVVLVYTVVLRNPFARRDASVGLRSRLVALGSIALWLIVAISGRWIGFS